MAPNHGSPRNNPAMTRCLSCLILLIATQIAAAEHSHPDPHPLQWTFDSTDTLPGEIRGSVEVIEPQLQKPRYPGFNIGNTALKLTAPAWLQITDDPADSRFDFDNGDAVTFEAWVRVDSIGENVYIIGKGRTGTSGSKAINQNWAFRLRKNKGRACVNFLFRSRRTDNHPGDWHRWTSNTGFSSGSRWHHIAVSYRFGQPKSIRGFIDGKRVKGAWDMGGATDQPPVVDNDDVWIGSTMGGLKNNSLHGAIDNLTIHRREVPEKQLISRFQWNPPPIKPPTIPRNKVVVQLFGPVGSISAFPLETGEPFTEWQQDEMAFVRLPHKYDSWGIREDWGKTLLVRAWADITFPKGEYQLLARSRGMARLKIDGRIVLATPPQKNRSGAHHVVDEIPAVPRSGMRPHAMNDSEVIVGFVSDGRPHRFQYEIIVGGPRYRTEFGETCLAIAGNEQDVFRLVSSTSQIELTDRGWQGQVERQALQLKAMDRGDSKHGQQASSRVLGQTTPAREAIRRTEDSRTKLRRPDRRTNCRSQQTGESAAASFVVERRHFFSRPRAADFRRPLHAMSRPEATRRTIDCRSRRSVGRRRIRSGGRCARSSRTELPVRTRERTCRRLQNAAQR